MRFVLKRMAWNNGGTRTQALCLRARTSSRLMVVCWDSHAALVDMSIGEFECVIRRVEDVNLKLNISSAFDCVPRTDEE